MSFAPLVSIITPMYRSGDTLPAAMNSLLKQEEWRWESIVVDDGSPDDSRAVAEAFTQRDRRFTVLSQKNAGACAARNTGLTVARGRYVLFLDADDWLEPTALSSMVRACERKQLSAVHGSFRYARPDGTITQWTGGYDGNLPLFEALSSSNVLALPSCVMIRRPLLDDIGLFDTSITNCGDWDLWARVARSECKVGMVDDCVTGYRMRMASLSRSPVTLLRDALKVLTRIHSHDDRVRNPQRKYAMGANPALLRSRMAGFTLYAASLAQMQGNSNGATVAMDSIERWPELSPDRVAEFLVHAACFSRCTAPANLKPIPADVQRPIDHMIGELARRSGVEDLIPRINHSLEMLDFGRHQDEARIANRMRLCRPPAADETMAHSYLRSLALQECFH